jgi:hypothetical protein
MESSKSNSIFILKLIGSLFSVVALLLSGLIVWLLFESHEIEPGADYKGFIVATGILNAATATIAIFIWWIISNKNKFLNYD